MVWFFDIACFMTRMCEAWNEKNLPYGSCKNKNKITFLRGDNCMMSITWITKKSFLNDNFALYITSWSWNWVSKSSCPILQVDFWGPKWAILMFWIRFKIVLGCTYIVQLLFSVSFDLNIWFWVGSFWLSLALMGYFWVVVMFLKKIWGLIIKLKHLYFLFFL